MRNIGLLFGLITVLAFVGCGEDGPVSSVTEDGINAPAGKLTVSATTAGGYRGPREQRMIFQNMLDAFNARDLDKHNSSLTEDVVYDGVPAPPPTQGKEALRTPCLQYRANFQIFFG